ncbi:hypothetical protein [Corynebacterium sp. H78]|uniref:hypothetical protein n=1 Tax=Corynebacterium sp. H78 TaxID=3133417 RepID=UPI0030B4D841
MNNRRNTTMKRLAALAGASMLSLTLVACGSGDAEKVEQEIEKKVPEVSTQIEKKVDDVKGGDDQNDDRDDQNDDRDDQNDDDRDDQNR